MKTGRLLLIVAFALFCTNAIAQETPLVELDAGYSFNHFNPAHT